MIRSDKRILALAMCLSGLAGFVDAIGFIELGGYFVSFMSGNSTRTGVGIALGSTQALIAGGLIVAFVCGVTLGSLTGAWAGHDRRKPIILLLVSMLLTLAALLSGMGLTAGAIALMAVAMGAENVVFEREGEVPFGLTYMTGALVKLGQRVAGAFLGGDRMAWLPFAMLWAGLVTGAALGASAYPFIGMQGLWIAALAAAVLAYITSRINFERR